MILNNGSYTLLQIEQLNGRDMEVGLIQEVQTSAPEVATVPARVIKGTSFNATRITSLPTGGCFRKFNGGVKTGVAGLSKQKTECYPYSRLIKVDPIILDAAEDDSEDELKALQQALELQAAFIYLGQQFYYGTGFDGLGFPGVGTMINPDLTLDAAAYNGVTLTSAVNGKCDTCFGVKFGPKNIHFAYGGDGNKALQFGEWYKTLVNDPTDATKQLTNWVSQLDILMGLANGSQYSVGAINNINTTVGKNATTYVPLTDDAISQLESQYPVGQRPDAYMVTRAALRSLQLSRSKVTIATGARSTSGVEIIAPLPTTTMEGIPFIVTDSLLASANPGKFLTAQL